MDRDVADWRLIAIRASLVDFEVPTILWQQR
jgi:hypothetical protein